MNVASFSPLSLQSRLRNYYFQQVEKVWRTFFMKVEQNEGVIEQESIKWNRME